MSKSILITGCSSGIGYDTAHFLHKHGYRVYATTRDAKDVARLRAEGLDAYVLDVRDAQNIKEVLDIITREGELYALFNNAGFGQPGALEDITTDVLKEQFETNFFGLHELTYQTLKIMRSQGYGRILQHSSVLGIISLRFRGAYNASKYAIEGLCDTLRLELMDTNIYICTINTGPIRSDFRKNAIINFKKNVVSEGSVFEKEYKEQLLSVKEKDSDLFTKNSDVVIKNVLHALESKNPKPRYYNTLATHLLAGFKRILPTTLLDRLLRKI
ncbi:dehydrogenase [Sulfurimonas hongkongensis]|uniref:Dehydrogenase n=1 Tax=Sulfurimonas hongkongensis TaxID=1172190 RepID=T0JQY4_9BACT|nr:SDR family NAD(P)-dependent oxidoreductase [Sulfurimonas hongkongensis]EQB39237.1 dehydrogenase [Sulfurimonas hongkongensis]